MLLFWLIATVIIFSLFFQFGRALARVNSTRIRKQPDPNKAAAAGDRTQLGLIFSDLPVGIASFDKGLRLDTFNPAFSALFDVEPQTLISRPKLDDLFEEFARRFLVPVPKDTKAWLETIKNLQRLDRDQVWQDNWPLPDGRTITVQARSYPKGGFAMMFTDRTEQVRREEDLTADLILLYRALNAQEHGVVCFDTGGALAFINQKADDIWSTEFRHKMDHPTFDSIVKVWQSKSTPNPFWGDLSDFAKSETDRVEWTGAISLQSGGQVDIRISPLSQSALMCEFWEAE